MWTRAELKQRGKASFFGNYWISVGAWVLFGLIVGCASFVAGFIPFVGSIAAAVFLAGPLTVGITRFTLKNRNSEGKIEDLFSVFDSNYMNLVTVELLKNLFIILWSLLFIIPGIIKSYEYRMVDYLLAENPEMDYREALDRSRQMMDGEKWNAFVLDLSFLGWNILSAFTFGLLALFFVTPYMGQTNAELYVTLSNNNPTVVYSNATEEDNF